MKTFGRSSEPRRFGPLTRALPVVAAALAPAVAWAGPIAVVEVDAPTETDMAASVQAALREAPPLEVIALERWRSAALEMGLDPVRDRVKVGRRLGAERMLRARVSRDGRRWRLTVLVYDGAGRRLERWRVKAKRIRRLEFLVRTKMRQELASAFSGVSASRAKRSTVTARRPGEPIRVGMLRVRGGKRTRARLGRLLKAAPDLRRVPDVQVSRVSAQLGASLGTSSGRKEVARTLRVQAWISVRSRGRRGRFAATAKVYDGRSGKLVDRVEGRGSSEIEALTGVISLLPGPLKKTRPPRPDVRVAAARPAPPRASRAPEPASSSLAMRAAPTPDDSVQRSIPVPDEPRSRSRSPLMVALGAGLQRRDFSYNDDALEVLRPYDLAGAPAIAAELRWYPAGHFTSGLLTHLGAEARLRYLVGVKSEDSDGTQFDTSSADVFAGLRGRIPLGRHEAGLGLGLGHHDFTVDVPEDGPALPAVGYTYLRIGADGRFALPADLQLYLGAAWRQVLSSGEISSEAWFPNATQGGIDAQLALGWAFFGGFEVRLGAEYTRYFFTLNPEQGDALIAGGALDQYIAGTFDLVWSLGG